MYDVCMQVYRFTGQIKTVQASIFFQTQHFFGPKIFTDPKKILDLKSFSTNIFWIQNFLDPKFCWAQFFWLTIVWPKKIFWNPKIFWPKLFLTQICWTQNFAQPKLFLYPIIWIGNFLGPNIFLDSMILTKLNCWPIEYFNLGVQLDQNGKLLLGTRVWPYSVLDLP